MNNWKIVVLLIFSSLTGWAQIPVPEGVPTIKGYDITVNDAPHDQQMLYLLRWYNGEYFVIDSAKVNKGTARFKDSKTILPCGNFYINISRSLGPHINTTPIDLILNQSNKAIVTRTDSNVIIKDNTESQIVNNFYTSFLKGIRQDKDNFHTLMQELEETMPEAFVTKYLQSVFLGLLETDVQAETEYDGLPFLLRQLNYIDLSDPRLIYTSAVFPSFLATTIEENSCNNSDTLISYADSILQKCKHPIVRDNYVKMLFTLLDSHNPDYDPVLVHLYDTYDKSWIEEGRENSYKRKIANLRKIIPGAKIPELISHDVNGKAISTNDIKTKYTVLWFWDPDCDHCQEMTPILHQLYRDHAEEWDFEVFAVEVNEDHDRWLAFSDKNELWDWTNLSTSMGEANLDFIEYFDIMTTPVMYLIDNSQDHTIIARQITLSELRDFFMNNNKK